MIPYRPSLSLIATLSSSGAAAMSALRKRRHEHRHAHALASTSRLQGSPSAEESASGDGSRRATIAFRSTPGVRSSDEITAWYPRSGDKMHKAVRMSAAEARVAGVSSVALTESRSDGWPRITSRPTCGAQCLLVAFTALGGVALTSMLSRARRHRSASALTRF